MFAPSPSRRPPAILSGATVAAAAAVFTMAPIAVASPLNGDERPVKPSIMLVIDTGGAMNHVVDEPRLPVCSPEGTTDPNEAVAYEQSRMAKLKEMLTGVPAGTQWCTYDDRNDHVTDADWPEAHVRQRCCVHEPVAGQCAAWTDCYLDDGRDPEAGGGSAPPPPFEGGVLGDLEQEIKFGLMTSDSRPRQAGVDGHWSFGAENKFVPDAINALVRDDDPVFAFGAARGVSAPNLGIRDHTAVVGPFSDPNKGRWNEPGVDVGESIDELMSHNELIRDRVRNLVPAGGSPLSPMLHDLVEYYETGAGGDPYGLCRRRSAVLITQGRYTHYYGGQSCLADVDCGAGGVCIDASVAGEQNRVCFYWDGYPYQIGVDYAEQMFAWDIPLFVVGLGADIFGEDYALDIADAGSPGMGPDGGPGYFPVQTADDLREAFAAIRNATLRGQLAAARPLVASPTPADKSYAEELNQPAPKQWRFSAFTELPGAGDPEKYGHLRRETMICEQASRLASAGATNLEEKLDPEERAGRPRRTFSVHPDGDRVMVVSGAVGAVFLADGTRGSGLEEPPLVELLEADGISEPLDLQIVRAGRKLDGYFGRRGLPNGPESDVLGRRQLGAMLNGEMVAIQRPSLGLQSPAYVHYAAAREDYRTLIAAGASDGMVHLFRAVDGYEVFNFVPKIAWRHLLHDAVAFPVDGPLATRDVLTCRTVSGEGDRLCPADPTEYIFRTLVVGGIGSGGPNVFGFDVSEMGDVLDNHQVEPDALFPRQGGSALPWNLTDAEVPLLGVTVSRPTLTHVRDNSRVVGAMVVGCGDDPRVAPGPDGPYIGACVLVVEALTGRVIQKFDTESGNIRTHLGSNVPLTTPVTGWPVAFPSFGVQAANRVYIGDRLGYLWRLEITEPDPNDWEMVQVWPPPEGFLAEGYEEGRPIIGRPSVSTLADGSVNLVFVTGGGMTPPDGVTPRAYVVSLRDQFAPDGTHAISANWVFPLADREVATGSPVTKDATAFFTTSEADDDLCATVTGRLYAVHSSQTGPSIGLPGGRQTTVIPRFPQFDASGKRIDDALALVLPPGRIASGLSIVESPSCDEGGVSTTEIVLNLADETQGAVGAAETDGARIERVGANGGVTTSPLDQSVFIEGSGPSLAICIDCDGNGQAAPTERKERIGPFPSAVTYWGGMSFAD